MTTTDPNIFHMCDHTWELSPNGVVINHCAYKTDNIHIVDLPDDARALFADTQKEWNNVWIRYLRMGTQRKILNWLTVGIVLLMLWQLLLPNHYPASEILTPMLTITVSALLVIAIPLGLTILLRQSPDDFLDHHLDMLNDRIEKRFPIAAHPPHTYEFLRHMTPEHARTVIHVYKEDKEVTWEVIERLGAAYDAYETLLREREWEKSRQQESQIRAKAKSIVDSLDSPDR